ncbi:uncharacterized protein A4U43_C10F2940 [Asparagus officinalis]|uniref:Saccharopine dehydrogenase-like C-terminal domain-containing protein n=1 Tax=Asparagus officinalis TaxID=4686 RepID=A0A5P1E200_ASPOF|nr:uncharacterized protein A4U43_C10F2940 [Asparagus officinalis]
MDVSSSLIIFSFASLTLSSVGLASANAPAIFVFGDSLADVGNNNNLNVPLDKLANFPPNGIDFPLKTPTGRFSNGYNTIDYLAQQMGYKQSPPSFLSVENGANISQGVNFASGGSGILDTTGPAITFTAQISNFKSVIYDLTKQMGKEKAEEFISKSLFFISAGNNDMFAYYSTTGAQNITQNEQFVTSLVEKFSQHIKALYIYGARKFGTIGLSHIGCIPLMRSKNPIGKCNDNLNGLARNFNTAAQVRMNQLESMLKGMKYSYGNAYDLMSIAMATPFLLGYKDFQSACCGSGKFNGKDRMDYWMSQIYTYSFMHKKHLVTASYVNDSMSGLHERAKGAGVTILGEMGLDPGIDHMMVMKMINQAHARKGKIISFTSYCGGLPSPPAANNPLAYKFR